MHREFSLLLLLSNSSLLGTPLYTYTACNLHNTHAHIRIPPASCHRLVKSLPPLSLAHDLLLATYSAFPGEIYFVSARPFSFEARSRGRLFTSERERERERRRPCAFSCRKWRGWDGWRERGEMEVVLCEKEEKSMEESIFMMVAVKMKLGKRQKYFCE